MLSVINAECNTNDSIILGVVMLNVVMLNVVMLCVLAPFSSVSDAAL
jgi:hypothetical protein